MLVSSHGAQGLILVEMFFFAVLHSGVLLPSCSLIHVLLVVVLLMFPIFRLGVCVFCAEGFEFYFKPFPCYFWIVILILTEVCVNEIVSATKSASDSDEESNVQDSGPLFML